MPKRKKNPDKVSKIGDLVVVKWIDAEADCSWGELKDVKEWSKKRFHCMEIGWVLEDTKEMLMLTSQIGDENLIGNRSKIPKPWVVSKKVIGKWKEKN